LAAWNLPEYLAESRSIHEETGTMPAAKQDNIRRKLEALRARLRPEVSSMTQQTLAPAGGQAANELSNVPFHLGDGGTEEYLHDLNATLLENEEYMANEVQAALKRLDDGTYGKCEMCGRDISAARLEAIPYTRYCIKCAEKAPRAPEANINTGRPRTPDDTLAPEGEMGESDFNPDETPFSDEIADRDRQSRRTSGGVHAVGEMGGGGPSGGLAGTNEGRGDPVVGELEEAMGSGNFDVADARDDDPDEPRSGHAGGAVGGTPAGKRARGT
jgi:RNA polymerase-binding transcription factor DksA